MILSFISPKISAFPHWDLVNADEWKIMFDPSINHQLHIFTSYIFQRSYRKELFDDAIARMTRACIKTNMEIEQFKSIQNKVEQLVIQKQKAEVDYGDIPDEFRGK